MLHASRPQPSRRGGCCRATLAYSCRRYLTATAPRLSLSTKLRVGVSVALLLALLLQHRLLAWPLVVAMLPMLLSVPLFHVCLVSFNWFHSFLNSSPVAGTPSSSNIRCSSGVLGVGLTSCFASSP